MSRKKTTVKEKILKNENVARRLESIIDDNTHFSIKEAYKSARTNLMFTLAEEEGCKKIIVTSSATREGKSTTTINLAITMAQTGAKVLVVEADLRKPKLHQYLNLKNNQGMTEYLGGFVKDPFAIVQKSEKHGIDCVTCGSIPPNPSELLLSSAMQHFLDAMSAEYDYIFVDSPPVNAVTDSVSIAKLMSGAVIVARQDYTTKETLKQAVSALEFAGTKILGYVLNGVKELAPSKYNYRKYKNPYDRYGAYGYGPDDKEA